MKDHDPHHPYVRKLIGCGHGVLFSDYCKDCEIVAVQEQYKNAIRTVQRCRRCRHPAAGGALMHRADTIVLLACLFGSLAVYLFHTWGWLK